MPNPHGTPNPRMAEIGKLPSPAKTEFGKFFRDLSRFKRERVPSELLELFDFCKGIDNTKNANYLVELNNLYKVIQKIMMPTLIDRLLHGEKLSKVDIDALRLVKDTLVESHKLKYGDKKVIENIVTVADIRRQMMSDKKIIDAEVLSDEPISQDLD